MTSLFLARQDDVSAIDIKAPEAGKPIEDNLARIVYTEGFAYKKKYAEALRYATAEGPVLGRLQACVAGADIALADAKDKNAASAALPFVQAGVTAYEEFVKENKDQEAPWLALELVRMGSRTDAAAKVKGLIDKLPAALRPRAQLDILQAQLDSNPAKIMENAGIDAIGNDKATARGFAWEAWARHNARLGAGIDAESKDESIRPLLYLGIALGEQDRKK
jgi:hypothetical protein